MYPKRMPPPSLLTTLLVLLLMACLTTGAALADTASADTASPAAQISKNDFEGGALTDAQRAHTVEVLEASRSELEALAAQAIGDAWSTQPADGGWSVGEVVEHLALAEEMFYGMVTGALDGEPNPEWQKIAAGGTDTIESNLRDRSQKFQAPEMLQPTGEASRADTLARYAAARARTLDFVHSTDAPLLAYTASGPPGTMNLQQWLVLAGAHNQRHNQQIQEVLDELDAGASSESADESGEAGEASE